MEETKEGTVSMTEGTRGTMPLPLLIEIEFSLSTLIRVTFNNGDDHDNTVQIIVFWVMTPSGLIGAYLLDGDRIFLQNSGNHPQY
jgi:hypothetical protein